MIQFHGQGSWELYDLGRDPRELRNVYADRRYASVLAGLRRELTKQRRSYRVPERKESASLGRAKPMLGEAR